jgi:hypothetical protein
MKKYIINTFAILAFCSFALLSCEKETDDEVEKIDQLFRPVLFRAAVEETNVTLTWTPIAGATYALEISKDSLLFETDLQVIYLDKQVTTHLVEELWSSSRYSARIKAVSTDASIKDSGYKEITFFTGKENIFYGVTDENIGSDHVLLKWIAGKNVSHIEVMKEGDPEDNIISNLLTEEDIRIGQKDIVGLSPGTTYIFKIYNGEKPRGTTTVTTKVNDPE